MTTTNGTNTATVRFPWGSGPAPALNCSVCGRRIGKTATHIANADAVAVICVRCAWNPGMHTAWYPNCDDPDHRFVFDHHPGHATRAGAWYVLTQTKVLA